MPTSYAKILSADGYSPARIAELTEVAKRYARDFSREVNKALAARNIVVTGGTWLPSAGGCFANGERGYTLIVGGREHRVCTYAEVRALAA